MTDLIVFWCCGVAFTWGFAVSRRSFKFVFGDPLFVLATFVAWPWALGLLVGEKGQP